jgi:DNA-binding NarL/FixJ family response regulator
VSRRRILVADDHLPMLRYARDLLASEFDVVATACNGKAALEAAATCHPELAVLDISMPEMSGLAAAACMADWPDCPRVVFLSVHDDPEFVDAARRVGAAGYVLKRSMAVDLLPTVRRALLDPQPVL